MDAIAHHLGLSRDHTAKPSDIGNDMTPDRLAECLKTLRWSGRTLTEALECDESLVDAWLDGTDKIPIKVQVWVHVLALTHSAAEEQKPSGLAGRRPSDTPAPAL